MQLVGLQFYRSPGITCCVPVPLKKVHVGVNVVDRVAAHTLEQTYSNAEESAIEAKYVFPLPENATVVDFAATFSDGRKITGIIKKREEAKHEYQQAVQRGRQAALLEEDRPDIFESSIGNIQAGEEVIVKLQYCLELPVEEDAVRLTIPSHVGERYSSEPSTDGKAPENLVYSKSGSGAPFSATVMCEMGGAGVPAISSPTHPSIQVQHGEHAGTATAKIMEALLSKDIVICIKPQDLFQPVIAWEEWSQHGTHALMLSLVPKFELPMIEKPEVVFVVDCSGSMGGQRIEQSKRAMQIFMRSLPEGCCFNIVRFGSHFSAFSQQSLEYSDSSIEKGSKYISDIAANMGGTEILKPLEFVHGVPLHPGYARQVIVLTDGQVRNEQQVINFARSTQSRIFSLGVGSGVSTFLVKGLARAANGHASFVQDNEKLEPVCISLLKKALTPAVSNIQISWPKISGPESENVPVTLGMEQVTGQLTAANQVLSFFNPAQTDSRAYRVPSGGPSSSCEHQQAPQKPLPVHADSNFCAFALYPSGVKFQDTEVSITGDTPAGKLDLSIPLPSVPINRPKPLVHRMAARALIRDLEEEPSDAHRSSDDATRLSLQFSVLCQSTAFVAVDSQSGTIHPVDINKRVVPQPSQWMAGGMGSMGYGPPPGQLCDGSYRNVQLCSVAADRCAIAMANCAALQTRNAAVDSCIANELGGSTTQFYRSAKKSSGLGLPSVSGMFGRLFGSSKPEATRASLGGQSSMYYDTTKKRWHEKGKVESEACFGGGGDWASWLQDEGHGGDGSVPSPPTARTTVKCEAEQKSSVPSAPSRMKALENLLCLAAANGSFDPAAQSVLGVNDEMIREWAAELGTSTKILLTALVLAYLRSEFPREKDTWTLVACKSIAWLRKLESEWKTEAIQDVEVLISNAAGKL